MNSDTYNYAFDDIGNRQTSFVNSVSSVYTANQLNQYSAVSGGMTANLTYDDDGSMTADGYWVHTWNGENRIISSIPNGYVATNGSVMVDESYDYKNRRVEKNVKQLSGRGAGYPQDPSQPGTWSTIETHKYIWDNWNIAAEIIIDTVTPATNITYYTWGLDLSGTLQGAGGVGGLLSETKTTASSTNSYFACADANGNVTEYVDNTGTVKAHYEYNATGEETYKSGTMVDDFIFRFSTKYFDAETGLYYYGYRYYDPVFNHWLSKDPIGERGGKNLYGFVENSSINQIDAHGLMSWATIVAALLEGAGIVVDSVKVPDWIDDQIIDSYGGPDGFMDETERELLSKGDALPRDMFQKARGKNKKTINENSTGAERALYDRLQSKLTESKLYKDKRDYIIKRLKKGTHYKGFLNIDFQDAGESSLGYAIGGAQLHYHYTSPPPKLKLSLIDTYDFTKKGHAWGKLQKDGYLVTYKVHVVIEEILCPTAAPEKK